MDVEIFMAALLGIFGGFVFLRWLHAMEETS
jgi:hypothetical protein